MSEGGFCGQHWGFVAPWLDGEVRRPRGTACLAPMMDAVIDQIDGRRIRIGDHWLSDFASCNYLGFDLDPEIMDAIPRMSDAGERIRAGRASWGAPCSTSSIEERSRLVGQRGHARAADDHAHP